MIYRIRVQTLTIATYLIALTAYFTASGSNKQAIEDILAPLEKTSTIALIVNNLNDVKKPLLAQNQHVYLQPASTMKILTSIIATESLNPKQPFSSEMRAYGYQKDGVFNGDIHLELGANPSFTEIELTQLVTAIKKRNIRQINGNVFILKNHFDEIEKIPGTVWDELNDCYATSVSDISYNQNCFYLTLLNIDHHISQYSTEPLQPIKTAIEIQDDCRDQTPANAHYPAYGYGVFLKQDPFKHPQTLKGCWAKDVPYWVLKRSLDHPDQILKAHWISALNQSGIQIQGNTQIITHKPITQQKPKWQITIPSAPLNKLLQIMLEQSNNHIANQLFKESAYQQQQSKVSWKDAQTHAQIILKKYHLDDEHSTITDGAGLSRNNRITAQQLQDSLITIYKTPKLQPLIKLFANPNSEQSTLTKRIENLNLAIFAKTGSINGVTAIAGYIDPYGKQPKAFTLLINGNASIQKNYLEIEPLLLQQINTMN